jgi:FkbM family methyltransferase
MNLTSFKINLFANQKFKLSKKYFSTTQQELFRKKSAEILDNFFFDCIDALNIKEFIECGAGNAYASKKLSIKGVNAIALEANPLTFDKLTLPDSNKVKCFNIGVGAIDEEIDFYIPLNNPIAGNATFQPKEFDSYIKKKVKVVKLDNLLNDLQFGSHLGALWIDVEGYQKKFLEGAKNYIQNPNLLIVKIEVEQIEHFKGSITSEFIDDIFKRFGFEPIFCDDEYNTQFNVVYIRKSSIDSISLLLEKAVFELNTYNPGLNETLNLLFKNERQSVLSYFKQKAIEIFGIKIGNKLAAFFGSKTSKQTHRVKF